MFINKLYNECMISWLKAGRIDKIIEIAESALELRKLASRQKYCARLKLFVKCH